MAAAISRIFPHVDLEPGRPSGDPAQRNEAPVACPPWIYNRNLVERLWNRLKEWRAVRRNEKTARFFMGVLCMAATMDWLKA